MELEHATFEVKQTLDLLDNIMGTPEGVLD